LQATPRAVKTFSGKNFASSPQDSRLFELRAKVDALHREDARDAGLLIEAEEEDLSPLNKAPKSPAERLVDTLGRSWGTGRRKTSTARAVLEPGTGLVWVNDRPLFDYFPRLQHRAAVLSAFQVTRTAGLYDAYIFCQGGGGTGQAEAARLGLARALQAHDPFLRAVLRDGVHLSRDRRAVERKKPGQAKARKKFRHPSR
jgi:small subunit ribosomal protein S9